MFEVGDKVKIREPFGDGEIYVVTAKMGADAKGEASDADVVYYQYEVNGSFYIIDHLEPAQ